MAAVTAASRRLWPMLSLFVLLLAALVLMSHATQNASRFGELYTGLLLGSTLGLLLLSIMIGISVHRLVRRYRHREPGARLSLRLVVLFVSLALAPVGVVYYFSLQFLQRGIDTWFDVRVEQALSDALELSRSSLDLRMREVLRQTQRMGLTLTEGSRSSPALLLDEMLNRSEASELTLIGQNGRIIATAGLDPLRIVPNQPPEIVLMQVRQGHDYVSLDPIRDFGFHIRAVVPVPSGDPTGDAQILQALYPVPKRLSELADSVQSAFDNYRELVFLRGPLKASFILMLSLVLLFGVLAAVWAALYSARRLVAPIRDLAEGTRSVAAGDYDKQLPLTRNDELGFLVHSFNQMMRNLAEAQAAERRSQQLLERQR
ncbi:MAG: HAMP domain-containing protein, partial [Candidatus Competibacterales bacterium]|nr:HAMP domain-containing protein [Candidatus Competibacterales bacterium]